MSLRWVNGCGGLVALPWLALTATAVGLLLLQLSRLGRALPARPGSVGEPCAFHGALLACMEA